MLRRTWFPARTLVNGHRWYCKEGSPHTWQELEEKYGKEAVDFSRDMESMKDGDFKPHQYTGPLYEIIRIRVDPAQMREFLHYYPKFESKKEGNGKLVAAFSVEIGQLNEFLHFWEWEDLTERQHTLESLKTDKEALRLESLASKTIIHQYRSYFKSDAKLHKNFVSEDKEVPTEQGIYEWEILDEAEFLGEDLDDREVLRSIRKASGGFLVGQWGPVVHEQSEDLTCNLWRYDNLHQYETFAKELNKKDEEGNLFITYVPTTEMLVPALHSPLQ